MKKNIIAIQADPLENLKTDSDSSLLIAAAAKEEGFKTFFYSPSSLILKNNSCIAKGIFAEVEYSNNKSYITFNKEEVLDLEKVKALLIRQDPPFDLNYLSNTYLLELLQDRVPIINCPKAIRSYNEKMAKFKFPDFIPPTLVISSITDEAYEFINSFSQVLIKPLYWFGGKFIELLDSKDIDKIKEILTQALNQHGHILLQKFLPAIYEGDKRVIIINGEIKGVIKRIPREGKFIANLAAGGRAEKTELTLKEKNIATKVGKVLREEGIIFAGLDLLDEYLIEINVTSPTGLVAIEKLYGVNLAKNLVDYIKEL